MFQAANDRGGDVEIVLVLHIAEFQQPATNQGIDITGIAQCRNLLYIQMTSQVAIVHAARASLHAYAEQHSLSFRDAKATCQQLKFRLGLFHKLLAHLRVIGQFHHALNSLEQCHFLLIVLNCSWHNRSGIRRQEPKTLAGW